MARSTSGTAVSVIHTDNLISNTYPFTWASGDFLYANFMYLSAA